MSEQGHKSHERHEQAQSHEQHQPKAEHSSEKHKLTIAKTRHERLADKARESVAEVAGSQQQVAEKLAGLHEAEPQTYSAASISRDLKKRALNRELQAIRRKLPRGERALSRIVHQPAIRVVSEAAGKTVSRPSGMLGGGLLAFIGSLVYYYLTHYIGFAYNYTVFLVLFVGGFVIGVVLEMIIWLALKNRRQLHD
ncbi:MAG TPA: hypothetical protein VG604_03235 [Candidatus Saccharimonadales bacterium]|nr:hypothetical protein [Candidatus Saccharimonadales bacterium]